MKHILRVQMLALVSAGLLAVLPRAGAQGFGLAVTPSASALLVNGSLTYTINVTNLNAIPLVDTQVTNVLSAPFQFVSATGPQGTYTATASNVVFDLTTYFSGYFQVAALTLTIRPTTAGSFTNVVTVGSITVTNIASTNAVVRVTNAVVLADVGVAMTGATQPAITNDWMVFGVTVSNAGPAAATGVLLTNTLPAGVGFQSVSPPGLTPAVAGSNVVFSLGTLAAGASTNLLLTVQPTNAGVLTFASFVSTSATDTNLANNSASTNITVTGYLPGQLTVTTNSAQSTNFISGLLEQTITVSNAGPDPVAAARVVVTGLTNRLFNAVGTNSGNPFVVYTPPSGAVLASGQSVDLLLQFFPRKAFPYTNLPSQLQAFAVPVPNWAPPPAAAAANVSIARIARLANGNMLIEWPAVSNRLYTVVYSDNVSFSNAMIAPPSVTAPANGVEWIDYGPPATSSRPASATNRFYRVYLNP